MKIAVVDDRVYDGLDKLREDSSQVCRPAFVRKGK